MDLFLLGSSVAIGLLVSLLIRLSSKARWTYGQGAWLLCTPIAGAYVGALLGTLLHGRYFALMYACWVAVSSGLLLLFIMSRRRNKESHPGKI